MLLDCTLLVCWCREPRFMLRLHPPIGKLRQHGNGERWPHFWYIVKSLFLAESVGLLTNKGYMCLFGISSTRSECFLGSSSRRCYRKRSVSTSFDVLGTETCAGNQVEPTLLFVSSKGATPKGSWLHPKSFTVLIFIEISDVAIENLEVGDGHQ